MSRVLKELVRLREENGYDHVISVKLFFMQGDITFTTRLGILIPLISAYFPNDTNFEIL